MKWLLKIGLIIFISASNINAAPGTAIFDIKAALPFPGTGDATPTVVNAGEQISGTYNVTLSARWPSRVRVFPAQLPSGMSMDTTIGCGKNPILSPGHSCQMILRYKVPSVTKRTLINQGPIVCTSNKKIHCSQPTTLNRFNMAIDSKQVPSMLLKGLQSLLLGNSDGNLNNWYKINQAENYNSIAYGNGRWVLVGTLTSDNKTNIQTSTDGIIWKHISLSTSDVLSGVYYSAAAKQWLLSGLNGVLYPINLKALALWSESHR